MTRPSSPRVVSARASSPTPTATHGASAWPTRRPVRARSRVVASLHRRGISRAKATSFRSRASRATSTAAATAAWMRRATCVSTAATGWSCSIRSRLDERAGRAASWSTGAHAIGPDEAVTLYSVRGNPRSGHILLGLHRRRDHSLPYDLDGEEQLLRPDQIDVARTERYTPAAPPRAATRPAVSSWNGYSPQPGEWVVSFRRSRSGMTTIAAASTATTIKARSLLDRGNGVRSSSIPRGSSARAPASRTISCTTTRPNDLVTLYSRQGSSRSSERDRRLHRRRRHPFLDAAGRADRATRPARSRAHRARDGAAARGRRATGRRSRLAGHARRAEGRRHRPLPAPTRRHTFALAEVARPESRRRQCASVSRPSRSDRCSTSAAVAMARSSRSRSAASATCTRRVSHRTRRVGSASCRRATRGYFPRRATTRASVSTRSCSRTRSTRRCRRTSRAATYAR